MFNKLKDKFFILECIVLVMFVIIFIGLVKLQIADNKKYTIMSESKLTASDAIPAPRGKILDRYGRPIVTNRLGFSVSFTNPSLSNDELNDIILNTINHH